MRLRDLVATHRALAKTRSRNAKVQALAACLARLAQDEAGAATCWLAGRLPQGRIGIGPAAIRAAADAPAADGPPLTIAELDRAFSALARISGPGSTRRREAQLAALFARASADERRFLARLLLGELRQGASEGLVVEGLAAAAGLEPARVRRALMLSSDLAAVAAAALGDTPEALERFQLELFRPVLPMLASPADDVDAALARLGEAAFEWKLDGARVQLHKAGDDARVFSRRQNDVTAAVPELVEAAAVLPARELILDGEALALRADGRPLPFQETMRRFGRRLDVARMREALPLSVLYFDCLRVDGQTLLDAPSAERSRALAQALPEVLRVPRLVTAAPEAADAFWHEALERGHEGLMAKSLAAPYAAGARGFDWLKLKPAHTLDLVVLAAEWGSGRRRGWLSNLHLGARDPASGGFVMLGKTFKGLTDALLRWQTERLLELETSRDAWTVHVRPELVVEVAVNSVQSSPHYPAGLALRFARVKRYRPDKTPDQATTVDEVRAIHAAERR
jgi:DNA ligase-1